MSKNKASSNRNRGFINYQGKGEKDEGQEIDGFIRKNSTSVVT